jgi:hypothetical protein
VIIQFRATYNTNTLLDDILRELQDKPNTIMTNEEHTHETTITNNDDFRRGVKKTRTTSERQGKVINVKTIIDEHTHETNMTQTRHNHNTTRNTTQTWSPTTGQRRYIRNRFSLSSLGIGP